MTADAAALVPVARVVVDSPLPHLDRLFDYGVPPELDGAAQPGVRVKVRFSGRLVGGFLLERVDGSGHEGRLSPLASVVSPERVLTQEVARLARAVADRYAGTMTDVLRLAVPPRHARVEKAPEPDQVAPGSLPIVAKHPLASYEKGAAFRSALATGGGPHAVWTVAAGRDWAGDVADAVLASLAGGRGAVVVVPDGRDVARVDAALTAALGPGRHTALTADLGPAERYRRFLSVVRGTVRVVVGTRAAAFAPVHDLGLAVVWDDGDDLHAEPRAPYPHVRDVLVQRAHLTGAALMVGGHAMTAESALLLESGWAAPLSQPRPAVRAAAPRVVPAGEDADLARDPGARAARLPTVAWQAARDALGRGRPVLVQVPRRGYQPTLACADCRTPARCTLCEGPLTRGSDGAVPSCGWCGRPSVDWACRACGHHRLRAAVVGARRTADELGRAFPGTVVRTSGRDAVLASVPDEPSLVVATPGAEPLAEGGYGTVLLLDAWALLGRPDLRAGEEALRRWLLAAALARRGSDGGQVVIMADASLPSVQALVRWDPAWHARRELADREALGFPPAVRMAALTGSADAIADLLARTALPPGAEVLGPLEVYERGAHEPGREPRQRALVRVSRSQGTELATAVKAAMSIRSARKATETVRVVLDPAEVG
jgi:primosomal protein N' (replication factor Y) (superfamily II helicase)